MEIIVPAAGLSSRFPNTKPKYLLYDYQHMLMVHNAVLPYLNAGHSVTIAILKEHDEKYNASSFLKGDIPNIRIVVIDKPTKGPADTVYQVLKTFDGDIEFLIKDCDSFFDHNQMTGNYICTSNIADHETINKLSSKSFIQCNNQGIITNIIEKTVISDTFCVGGYKFDSSQKFIKAYKLLEKEMSSEIYVSHIIEQMLSDGEIFSNSPVTNYIDVGTLDDWLKYNDKPVFFCDIDGTLVKSQSRYGENSFNNPPTVLQGNVDTIKKYVNKGCQIIFTTARTHDYYDVTRKMLEELGFKKPHLICGLHNTRRILINDFNEANPHPRATAINIRRDTDSLKDFL